MAIYYVNGDVGSDANAGTSAGAGNAWLTIDKAMNTVAAGDKVWINNVNTYAELATIDTAGTVAAPIEFEGYGSVTGDNGIATITGSSARTNCIADSVVANTRIFYLFKNFRFTAATADGVLTDSNATIWKNCQFDTNSGDGFQGGYAMFENCKFNNNSVKGLNHDRGNIGCIGCRFYNNATDGINSIAGVANSLVLLFCEFYSNGSNAIVCGGANDNLCVIVNCTIDGDSKNSNNGISFNTSFRQCAMVCNNIFYDCTTGVSFPDQDNFYISRNNLVNANTTDYSNFSTFTGEVISAPGFNNEGDNDYRPSTSSPLIASGYDANVIEGYATAIQIGALEVAPTVCNYPAVEDVQSGVVFSASSTGTFGYPTVGQVLTGIGYGADSTEYTGTRTDANVNDVESGVLYGSNGTGFTGEFVVPLTENVASGIGYGDDGVEFVGTLAADVPTENDVRNGISYSGGSLVGNLEIPIEPNVKDGVGYGSLGTEFQGTFVGTSGIIVLGDIKMPLIEYEFSADEPVSLIGDFDTGKSVTIEIWIDGVIQVLVSNVCTEISDTGKYTWSISNLPVLDASRKQYHYRMTDDLSNTVEGDFVLRSLEATDGFMPSLDNKGAYILKI